ncbi:DUF6065 family protein [Sphingomonas glacialis]|uniref:Cupin-like domain-containing protein n=1 Tax=Sphingomonas glacialis TaxID=658225 RepID=A0A502G028_9SPHN|nr:DUF6065 family protein [Sphingomonas glacialis]TPG54900.1 cupin-like domain-containing protein [Sphingomonas glacialis]
MELTAYLHPGWAPLVRPAPATRAWMDRTPESFAYRCLPLNIANAHGWEVLSPCGFTAIWDGGTEPSAVTIALDEGTDPARAPVSLFGQGIVTFHIEAIFRTPPGWNLWIGGSPNRAKDAIAPLTGIIETDWSPFTFTMNWRFTRPGTPIRFEPLEPFCFLFPVQRTAIEAFEPAFAPLDADPATAARFQAWSAARDAFHGQLQRDPPKAPADRWQKHYYRGEDVAGEKLVTDHRTKLKLRAFDRSTAAHVPIAPMDDPAIPAATPPEIVPMPAASVATHVVEIQRALDKREWLLEALERQRALAPGGGAIERRSGMGTDEFLKDYYAPARPVILGGAMDDWPALKRWSPAYLKALIGAAPVEYQGGRSENARFELDKDRHRRTAPFEAFIDTITGAGAGNDAYLTAYNSDRNQQALAPMIADMGFLDAFLTRDAAMPNGMPWIGPAGTVTSLHHDLTNNFIAQIVGRKRLTLVPAAQVGRLYNAQHVFSQIADLDDPDLDMARYPALADATQYDVILEPGEILFVPLGWWHQVKALDFSVTLTFTNFRWANDAYASYPAG